jgi:5'-methylthioadenosine phosphorylase
MTAARADIGIIGGSGLQALAAQANLEEVALDTPFGAPSGSYRLGEVSGRRVAFLCRHGEGHRLSPSEINYRANVWGLKALGVRRVVSASAVGSLKLELRPRDFVVVDQFIDRTKSRPCTFFGGGLVAHAGFADPLCPQLRSLALEAAGPAGVTAHDGGTYVCMEGPQFSTRAESNLYRSWGADVIGMTNLTEAKLAREAELCYVTLAMVTDYDCWHDEEEAVSVEALLGHLRANAESANRLAAELVGRIPEARDCACGEALRTALITRPEAVPEETRSRLGPLVDRYLG